LIKGWLTATKIASLENFFVHQTTPSFHPYHLTSIHFIAVLQSRKFIESYLQRAPAPSKALAGMDAGLNGTPNGSSLDD
jgi:hypothetical protein